MSLVAYESSDEDDLSQDESCTGHIVKADLHNCVPSENDHSPSCTVSSTTDVSTDHPDASWLDGLPDDDDDHWLDASPPVLQHDANSKGYVQPNSSLFASLPLPKHHITVAEQPADFEDAPETEGFVPKTRKGPVKIVIPSLSQFQDEPLPKRKLPLSSKSGLLQLLPSPKPKALGKTTGLLMPQVLTKKTPTKSGEQAVMPGTVSSTTVSEKKSSSVVQSVVQNASITGAAFLQPNEQETSKPFLVEYDDAKDSDDNCDDAAPHDFFSLHKQDLHEPLDVAHSDTLQVKPEVAASVSAVDLNEPLASGEELPQVIASSVGVSDAPLNFKLGWLPPVKHQSSGPSAKPSTDVVDSSEYNNLNATVGATNEGVADAQNIFSDEGFLRLQGKKQRGKEEIQLIDISVDDQLPDPQEAFMKTLTEEGVRRPSRRKDGLPTQQQRRKHQITYLAFQAKERELELKNQWSQNRLTRRQTQAKYGF